MFTQLFVLENNIYEPTANLLIVCRSFLPCVQYEQNKKKKTGKCSWDFSFALRPHECDGQLPVFQIDYLC